MPTFSLADIQQDILDRLDGNDVLYTTKELANVVNEGYRLVNAFCGINQITVALPGFSVAGQLVYAVPAPIMFPLTAWFEGAQLLKVSLGALARDFYNWATDTTIKLGGPVQHWAPIGIRTFVIHPVDSIGGRNLAVTGVVDVPKLVASADTINVEDEFLDMIVSYGVHRLQLKEGGKGFADASLSLNQWYAGLRSRMMLTGMRFQNYRIYTGVQQ